MLRRNVEYFFYATYSRVISASMNWTIQTFS